MFFVFLATVTEPEKNKDPYKLTWLDYLVLVVVGIAFYFYKDSHEDILNYPGYLKYATWGALFVAIVVIRFKKFEAKYLSMSVMGERLFYAFLSLVGSVIVTSMAAGLLLTPFNYYNIHVASKTIADTVRCEIDAAYIGKHTEDGSLPNIIKYHFLGNSDSIQTPTESVRIANMNVFRSYSQYWLVLTTHKALLGTYWIEDWKIVNKAPLPVKTPK